MSGCTIKIRITNIEIRNKFEARILGGASVPASRISAVAAEIPPARGATRTGQYARPTKTSRFHFLRISDFVFRIYVMSLFILR